MCRGVFGACEFGLLFERFSLGPPYEEFQKMADFGVFAKLAIARNCEHSLIYTKELILCSIICLQEKVPAVSL